MSNVQVSLHIVEAMNAQGTAVLVPSALPYGTPERIVSSGSSQASTLAAPAAGEVRNYVWRIANNGADHINVAFAAAPTATSGSPGVPAGTVQYFGVKVLSEKVAVINS